MPNFGEDFYCQTCGYEHRNCTCNGDPRDAKIAELEAQLSKGHAGYKEVVERRGQLQRELDAANATIARVRDVADGEYGSRALHAALNPTTEGSE